MDTIFITKLVLSFLIGGAWAIIATVAADRFGSKIGGLITALPSTILFSLFFMGWVYTPAFASAATTIAPVILAVDNVFVFIYIALAKKGLPLALGAAFMIWFGAAFVIVSGQFADMAVGFSLYVITAIGVYYLVEHVLQVPSVTGINIAYSPKTILFRGLLSGSVIAFAVVMGKVGGPLLGGAFSTFPAMFTSTMLITYFSRGAEFSAATMKSAFLGMVTVVVHAFMVRMTYVPFGVWWGTIVSVLVSFTTGYLVYRVGIKKLR